MWSNSEEKAFKWFKEYFDSDAELQGGTDSTVSDIYSPALGCFIEIKQLLPSARCGQFTAATAYYPECQAVMNGDESEYNAKAFVRHHYNEKDVQYVIVVNDDILIYSIDAFLNTFNFSWQSYHKKSGTSSLPLTYRKEVEDVIECHHEDKRTFVDDLSKVGTYFWIKDREYYISNSDKCYGEIRKCSNTKSFTWLVEVK